MQKDGTPFTFEILERQASLEVVINPWIQNLQRLGIKASMRVIDITQYINRINEFDFDSTVLGYSNSLSPGNELSEFWGSDAAGRSGSANYSGVKDAAVDALIAKIIDATDRDTLVAGARALDRVLTWNHYRLLHYSSPHDRIAYWDKLKRPDKLPLMGIGAGGAVVVATWWVDPAKAEADKK